MARRRPGLRPPPVRPRPLRRPRRPVSARGGPSGKTCPLCFGLPRSSWRRPPSSWRRPPSRKTTGSIRSTSSSTPRRAPPEATSGNRGRRSRPKQPPRYPNDCARRGLSEPTPGPSTQKVLGAQLFMLDQHMRQVAVRVVTQSAQSRSSRNVFQPRSRSRVRRAPDRNRRACRP